MHSFQRVLELMNEHSSPLEHDDSRGEEKCIAAIRTGLNINPDFWDCFLRVCNNPDTLSVLLDIPKERMSKWPQRIRTYLESTKKLDGDSEAMSRKAKLLSTGH